MEFRQLDLDDSDEIKQIISIEEEVFGKNGGVDEWLLKPLAKYGKVFVVKICNKVVGVAEFIQKFGENEVYLYGLATEKNSRGKGVAEYLLRNSLKYFTKYDIKLVHLTVSEENKAAVGLYEKLGFEKKKILKNEYGIGVDRLYMIKKIN